MIKMLKSSAHHQRFRGEPISRTIIDLLLCDRLLALDDRYADKILQVATEVDIRSELVDIGMKVGYHAGYVAGRADYVLSYGRLKSDLENVLVVIEAKKVGLCSTAIAQTLCYLGGIQNARKRAGKINIEVFGIMADTDEFRFALLDDQRTAYLSKPLSWKTKSGRIVAFLDCILCSAIESSPHTTPVKINNKQIKQYSACLKEKFVMLVEADSDSAITSGIRDNQGEGQEDKDKGEGKGEDKDEIEGEDEIEGYDVVQQDGKSVLVPSSTAERMQE